MKSTLSHLQVNIDALNRDFYKDLMTVLNWKAGYEDESMVSFSDANGSSIWFMPAQKAQKTDFDGYGVNHIGFSVENQADVDSVVKFLEGKAIPALFETPRHRPDFVSEKDQTYYQVMFTSPDNILFEVMYSGKKS